MARFIFLIPIYLVLISCSKVETASDIKVEMPPPTPVLQNQAQTKPDLKPVSINLKLSSKQKKYLNDSLPPQVREVLEKAESFEILAEDENRDVGNEGMSFEPNRIVKIANENHKKEILEAFYSDASTDEPPAACYIPHHAIRARYQNKTVKVEICFQCAVFIVESSIGKFEGTLVRENRTSEDLFNRIVEAQSVAIE